MYHVEIEQTDDNNNNNKKKQQRHVRDNKFLCHIFLLYFRCAVMIAVRFPIERNSHHQLKCFQNKQTSKKWEKAKKMHSLVQQTELRNHWPISNFNPWQLQLPYTHTHRPTIVRIHFYDKWCELHFDDTFLINVNFRHFYLSI